MHQEIKNTSSYSKNLTVLCISSALFGLGCVMLGYLFLPFAAASYAMLLHYEKKSLRIFSYVIPVAIFVINVLLNSVILNNFFSHEGIFYVIIGALLYHLNEKKKSKRETVFYLTLTLSALLIFSLFSIGFSANSSLSFSSLRAFYSGTYDKVKRIFIELVSSISTADESGNLFFIFTRDNAENIFHGFLLSIPSYLLIIAFFLTGLTYKFYDFYRIRFFSKKKEEFERFVPSKFLAYSYIAVAILSLLSSSGNDVFAITIQNVNTFLMFVFAYTGLTVAYTIFKIARGPLFATALIVFAFLFLASNALLILSFFGVFFAISSSRAKEN